MTKDEDKPRVRITHQFRKREAMVYDLACDDVRLTLEITAQPTGEGLKPEWYVEAFARPSPEKPIRGEPGATRREALSAVARAWIAKKGMYGFPTVDWDAVAEALLAVRAI
jgi:hypothetical protein